MKSYASRVESLLRCNSFSSTSFVDLHLARSYDQCQIDIRSVSVRNCHLLTLIVISVLSISLSSDLICCVIYTINDHVISFSFSHFFLLRSSSYQRVSIVLCSIYSYKIRYSGPLLNVFSSLYLAD